MHYHRWQRHGDPLGRSPEQLLESQRFWAKVDKNGPGGCWLWVGARSSTGYGNVYDRGRWQAPHRIVAEAAWGPIPDGMQVDHLCRIRACVNPNHLDVVTRRENTSRGANSDLNPGKTSRYVGVSWFKAKRRWHASASGRHLGSFRIEDDAARAYDAALIALGEQPRNFPAEVAS